MRKLLLAGIAGFAMTAGAAAQTTVTVEPLLSACASGLSAADLDRDGWITRAEADASLEATFQLLDGDADGAVTAAEFAGCKAGSGLRTSTVRTGTLRADHPAFAADRDGDRALDRDEWMAAAEIQMDKLPFSGGVVNVASFDATMQGFALPGAQADANGDGRIGTLEAAEAVGEGFLLADANGNGVVSFAEFGSRDSGSSVAQAGADPDEVAARLRDIWSRIDADRDGAVTIEEYRAAGEARWLMAADAAASDPDVAIPVTILDTLPPP